MERSTFGLSTAKLIKLLGVVKESHRTTGRQTRKHAQGLLLDRWLSKRVAFDVLAADTGLPLEGGQQAMVRQAKERPLGSHLLDPDTQPFILTLIKELAKEEVLVAKSGEARDTAKALYYGALASALVFQKKTISTQNQDELRVAFAHLAQAPWVRQDLVKLFDQAHAACAVGHSEKKKADA